MDCAKESVRASLSVHSSGKERTGSTAERYRDFNLFTPRSNR